MVAIAALIARRVGACRIGRIVQSSRPMSTNWAGNVQYPESQPVATPLSFESLQETVRGATTVRPVGTGHSFVPCMTVGDVGGGSEVMLSLMQMPRVFDLDVDAKTVTIDGGMTYTELAGRLRGTGLTLANTQSLPHITVAGAVSTGTHGSSGVCGTHGRASLGSQSVQVAALEVLNPEGDPVWFRRGEPGFNGAVISFGCLGPMTKITLDLVPEFDVLQSIYGSMGPAGHHPIDTLLDNWTPLLESYDSVSVFVDWPREDAGMVVGRTFGPPGVPMNPVSDWNGIPLVTDPLPPLLGTGREFKSTCQGTSLNSLFWFLESGEVFGPQAPELQLEYFVPLKDATEALRAVQRVASKWGTPVASDPLGQPLLLYCELRVVRGDDLWLSQSTTADGGDTLALAFGMNKSDYTAAMRGATALENQLAQFSMRPHWAKLHTMTPSAVTALYGDNWGKFVDLCAAHDPDHKFLNDWATSHLYPHA